MVSSKYVQARGTDPGTLIVFTEPQLYGFNFFQVSISKFRYEISNNGGQCYRALVRTWSPFENDPERKFVPCLLQSLRYVPFKTLND